MAEECNTVVVPALTTITDPCEGKHTSTECVFTEEAISYLGVAADASLKTIIDAIVTKLQAID